MTSIVTKTTSLVEEESAADASKTNNNTNNNEEEEAPPPPAKRPRVNDGGVDVGVGSSSSSSSSIPSIAKTTSTPSTRIMDRIHVPSLTLCDDSSSDALAQDFFRNYVARRKPCILTIAATAAAASSPSPTLSADDPSKASHVEEQKAIDKGGGVSTTTTTAMKAWPSLAVLDELLGDCVVQVERRLDEQASFGQNRSTPGSMETLVFQDLVRQAPAQRHQYYLSTQQQQEEDEEGGNDVNDDGHYPQYSCLTCRLVQAGYIPASLPLAGHLQLQSCHLWMGSTANSSSNTKTQNITNHNKNERGKGSCSGLHHDFHDNFYWLQAGRKVFYLYPPTTPIPVHGTIDTIHTVNGLISYQSQPTRADGVPWDYVNQNRHHHHHHDDHRGDNDHEGDDDDSDQEEEEDVVIGKGYDYQSEEDEEDGGADWNSSRDDFDPADGVDSGNDGEEVDENEDEQVEIVIGNGFDYKSEDDEGDHHEIDSTRDDYDAALGTEHDEDNKGEDDSKKPAAAEIHHTKKNNAEKQPDHFSPVDLNSPTFKEDFPVMQQECCEPYIVELQAGEMLYLPASWFHCVWSYSGNDGAVFATDDDAEEESFHIAVNYWYYPPDQLNDFFKPYKDHEYWFPKDKK